MKNKTLNITLHTSCLRVYHNCQPRQLAIQISLIPHFTTHFTTRNKIGQLTIQLTIQLTSKLDTIIQISTQSTTHFTTHSNSTHPCTTHHLAIPTLYSQFGFLVIQYKNLVNPVKHLVIIIRPCAIGFVSTVADLCNDEISFVFSQTF